MSRNEERLKLIASMTKECPEGIDPKRWKAILKIVEREKKEKK